MKVDLKNLQESIFKVNRMGNSKMHAFHSRVEMTVSRSAQVCEQMKEVQRRREAIEALAIQITSAIKSAKEPLVSLTSILEDLPRFLQALTPGYASTLAHVPLHSSPSEERTPTETYSVDWTDLAVYGSGETDEEEKGSSETSYYSWIDQETHWSETFPSPFH